MTYKRYQSARWFGSIVGLSLPVFAAGETIPLPDAPAGVEDASAATDATIVRSRPVLIDGAQLAGFAPWPGVALSFPLFADVSIPTVVERAETPSPGTLRLFGSLGGESNGTLVMVVRNGVVVANLRAPGAFSYQIRYLGDGIHVVREIDEAEFLPDATPQEPPPPGGGLVLGCDDDGSEIDMLVVYTAAARSAQGGTEGIQALITLAEAETEQGYLNSQITPTINVVMTYEVDYAESSDVFTDRDRIQDPDDGYMDEVPYLRNLDRGRKSRLSSRPLLPPNRTCGSPAYGSPVGGSPRSGLTDSDIGCLHAE